MNVLLIGEDAQTHALAWKISKSSVLDSLFILPGNYGTKEFGTNIEGNPLDFNFVSQTISEQHIQMTIVCDDKTLKAGIIDFFEENPSLASPEVIGTGKKALQLSENRLFAKELMKKYKIPTANYKVFTKKETKEALVFLEQLKPPYILQPIKEKGNEKEFVYSDLQEAQKNLSELLSNSGLDGVKTEAVLIEETLPGQTFILSILTDGDGYKILPDAKISHHLRKNVPLHEKIVVGTSSPVKFVDDVFQGKVQDQILVPVLKALRKEKINCNGFLSLFITNNNNEPYLIGFSNSLKNGVAETIFPRLKSDLLDLFDGVSSKTLSEHHIEIDIRSSYSGILYVANISGKPKTIYGLNALTDCRLFFENVKADGPALTTSEWKVLTVNSVGKNIDEAIENTLENLEKIVLEGAFYQKNISSDTL